MQTSGAHSSGRSNRIENVLIKKTAALTALRSRLRNEIARHKTCEKQLTAGAQYYSQLLAHFRRMQEQARRVAHQVLKTQEEERKEISREQYDEIAQILAGINVQLAVLSKAAAIDGHAVKQR